MVNTLTTGQVEILKKLVAYKAKTTKWTLENKVLGSDREKVEKLFNDYNGILVVLGGVSLEQPGKSVAVAPATVSLPKLG